MTGFNSTLVNGVILSGFSFFCIPWKHMPSLIVEAKLPRNCVKQIYR